MPIIEETSYQSPYLFSNPHLGTVLPNLFRIPGKVKYDRQRIDTPDGDFLDLDWSRVGGKSAILISHGLEGSSKTSCVVGMVRFFNQLGYDVCAWNFRSCSGEPNRTKGFYHPGMTDDFDLVVQTVLGSSSYEQLSLLGFSLGGAYTLRYLGEKGKDLRPEIHRAVTFSVPCDLGATSVHLSQGSQSWYGSLFLFKYKRKMTKKENLYPGSFDMSLWGEIKTVKDFDRLFNCPLYGFSTTDEFYEAVSPTAVMDNIQIPTLIVNAKNDPFLAEACFPYEEARKNPFLFLETPDAGGHMGFVTFKRSGIFWSETRAEAFLKDPELDDLG